MRWVFDWFFCADVMEHIPPEFVDATLDNIAHVASKGGFFQIALSKDGCGALIGDTLHLTVESPEWWMKKINHRWVVVSHEVSGGHLLIFVGKMKI